MKEIDKVFFGAIYDSDVKMMKFALLEGANINARDKWNCTPLHEATAKQNVELVEFLINRGADINLRNRFNNTPLGLTDYNSPCGKILREHGAVI